MSLDSFGESLTKIGMIEGSDVEVDIDLRLRARHWSSEYAELYVVDAAGRSVVQLNQLLGMLDSVVAQRLRESRNKGNILDAHVCIIVDDSALLDPALKSESESSRFVSRKYWIDRSKPLEEILQRLTLAWIDIDADSGLEPGFSAPSDLDELRERIELRKGAGAASDFIDGPQS